MLKWYNASHVYQGVISKYKDLKIESDLKTADKTLSVTLLEESGITNECYVRTATDEYVVKEVSTSTGAFKSIVCALNLEDLEAKAYKSFSVTGQTIANAARTALTGTGWTVDTSDVTKQRNAGMLKKNALQVLQDLCTAFMCEMSFDTINKKVSFYESMGSDRGVYFRSGLNLKKLTAKTSSYDFYTRIIPYGADDLDIKSVNGGVEYLSNTQYSSKVRTYIWIDTNYTDATALKEDAAAKLADMSKPTVSYSAEIRDLAKMSNTYSLFEYGLGDTVTLTDADTKVRDKQRIVKLTEYPDTPEKNTCQLSNTFLTWEEMQAKQQAAAAIVDAVISQDGTYNGSVKVSDILHWNDALEAGIENSSYLGSYIQATDGRIELVEASVGTIEANYITAEQVAATYATISSLEADYATITSLNAVSADVQGLNAQVASIEAAYIDTATVNTLLAGKANITLANIDTANINKGVIKDLFTEVGLVRSATIVDGHITGYLDAVNIDCNNITAGTLVADRIAIRGSNQSLVYALNNYGQITSQQVDTIDGYILTERTVNADRIVAGSITANEIAATSITADKLKVSNFSAVSGNIINITAGILTSADWDYDYVHTPIYATAGMRISLTDKYIRTPNFAVVNGNLYARNGTFSGSVTATSGNIAGWDINDYQISYYDVESTQAQYGVVVRAKEANSAATPSTYHFLVYHRPYENGAYGNWVIDFGVKHDGSFIATSGSLSSISINNGAFSVTPAGVMNATGATISGAITATSGSIGGYTVSSTSNTGTTANGGHCYTNSLYTHSSDTDYEYESGLFGGGAYNNAAFYVRRITKNAQWSTADYTFYVRNDGYMYATRGQIAGWDITSTALSRGGGYNSPTANSMYFGTSGLSVTDKFYVTATGETYIKGQLHINDNGTTTSSSIQLARGFIDCDFTNGMNITSDDSGGLSVIADSGQLTLYGDTGIRVLGTILTNVDITGTLQTSANINIVSTNTAAYAVGVQNAAKKVQLYIASNGNMGVYNATDSHYVVYEDADNVIRMPQVYAKTNPGVANVYIDSYGRMYKSTAGSSRRYKHDIEALTDYKKILDIPVVSFIYNDDHLAINDRRRGLKCPGLIAEDVDRYYSIATEKQDGPIEDWNIRYIVPPMLAVEQDHEKRITELEERLRKEAV